MIEVPVFFKGMVGTSFQGRWRSYDHLITPNCGSKLKRSRSAMYLLCKEIALTSVLNMSCPGL